MNTLLTTLTDIVEGKDITYVMRKELNNRHARDVSTSESGDRYPIREDINGGLDIDFDGDPNLED